MKNFSQLEHLSFIHVFFTKLMKIVIALVNVHKKNGVNICF